MVEDIGLFHFPFRNDILALVSKELYLQFMRDVKELCVRRTNVIETEEIDYELMGLAYQLAKLDKEWKYHIKEK